LALIPSRVMTQFIPGGGVPGAGSSFSKKKKALDFSSSETSNITFSNNTAFGTGTNSKRRKVDHKSSTTATINNTNNNNKGSLAETNPKLTTPNGQAAAAAASQAAAAKKAEMLVKKQSYAQLDPIKRRERLVAQISDTCAKLQTTSTAAQDARIRILSKKDAEVRKIVETDNVLQLHTACMWKVIDSKGYFSKDTSVQDSSKALEATQSPALFSSRNTVLPQVPSRVMGIVHFQTKTMTRQQEEQQQQQQQHTTIVKVEADEEDVEITVNKDSLEDRLLALLVPECGSDDDHDEVDDDMDDEDDESIVGNDENDDSAQELQTADLSALSLDERLFLHCRSQHFSLGEFHGIEETKTTDEDDDDDEAAQREYGDREEFVNLIGSMSSDLAALSKTNNARVAFLKAQSQALWVETEQVKRQDEHRATLISKCQALLKRSKESKAKSSRVKAASTSSSKKDEYALPW
jgi:hypothetical protein